MSIMEWRTIQGYEQYEVSENGQVRRRTSKRNNLAGKVLAQHLTHDGYPRLTLHRDRTSRMFTVHVLVAAAFLGPRPDGMGINHKDSDRANNHQSNLEYATPKQNSEHALAKGRIAQGEDCGNAKLTWKQVRIIRDTAANGVSGYRLAKKFNVSFPCVYNILNNKTWRKDPEHA